MIEVTAQAHGDYQSVGGGRSGYPDAQPLWRHLSHQQVTTVDISAGLLVVILTIFLNLSRQRPVSISRGIPDQVRKEHNTSQIEKPK